MRSTISALNRYSELIAADVRNDNEFHGGQEVAIDLSETQIAQKFSPRGLLLEISSSSNETTYFRVETEIGGCPAELYFEAQKIRRFNNRVLAFT